MKLHQLRAFVTVIEQSSISGAARQLSMTPSSVSAHIKALETEFGIELFLRTHRGVELTDTGRTLEQHARQILAAADGFAEQAGSCRAQVAGKLRLALSVSNEVFDLSTFVRRLEQDFPDIDLHLSHDESARILHAISRRDIDMGIVYGEAEAACFHAQPLARAELVIAMPRKWTSHLDNSWSSFGAVPWINTGNDCPYQLISRRLFAAHGIQPPEFLRVDDNHTRRHLVAGGFGMSLLERSEAEHPHIAIVDAEPLPCPTSLVFLLHRQREPVIKAAREIILNCT